VPFPERLTTERLTLRRWREEDREAIAAVWADPGVWRSLRPGATPDPAFAAARIDHHLEHWDRHGFGQLSVVADGQVAGWVGPAHPDFLPDLETEVEVGWALRAPFRGRGLATEAARAAIAASFAALEVPRLISLIDPTNRASQRVAARLGMRRAGEASHDELGMALEVHELRRRDWRPGVGGPA
jgi:RimJ/RimL family protein N-acetyltransferase